MSQRPRPSRSLHDWSRRILTNHADLRDDLTGLTDVLRLGVIPAAMPAIALLATRLLAAHPAARVEVLSMTSRAIQRALDGFEIDGGVTYLDNEPLENIRVARLHLIVDGGKLAGVGAHSYSAGNAASGSEEAARFSKARRHPLGAAPRRPDPLHPLLRRRDEDLRAKVRALEELGKDLVFGDDLDGAAVDGGVAGDEHSGGSAAAWAPRTPTNLRSAVASAGGVTSLSTPPGRGRTRPHRAADLLRRLDVTKFIGVSFHSAAASASIIALRSEFRFAEHVGQKSVSSARSPILACDAFRSIAGSDVASSCPTPARRPAAGASKP